MTGIAGRRLAVHAISTHTLTWSVTHYFFIVSPYISISTHTLTWSVTKNYPHAPFKIQISTHTLTWSVTFRIVVFFGIVKNFNSHAHVERDVGYLISKCCLKDFNSHAHVERDKVLQ